MIQVQVSPNLMGCFRMQCSPFPYVLGGYVLGWTPSPWGGFGWRAPDQDHRIIYIVHIKSSYIILICISVYNVSETITLHQPSAIWNEASVTHALVAQCLDEDVPELWRSWIWAWRCWHIRCTYHIKPICLSSTVQPRFFINDHLRISDFKPPKLRSLYWNLSSSTIKYLQCHSWHWPHWRRHLLFHLNQGAGQSPSCSRKNSIESHRSSSNKKTVKIQTLRPGQTNVQSGEDYHKAKNYE